MGYNTTYKLKLHNARPEQCKEVFKEIEETSKYTLDDIQDDEAELADAHWYNYGHDLTKVSKKFPGIIIEIYAEGEDRNDTWQARYLNGNEEHIDIVTTLAPLSRILTDEEKNQPAKQKEYFEITSVSRADLEAKGFDVSDITDEMMQRLANKMANDYLEQLFWTSMAIIAENLGFPMKSESVKTDL